MLKNKDFAKLLTFHIMQEKSPSVRYSSFRMRNQRRVQVKPTLDRFITHPRDV